MSLRSRRPAEGCLASLSSRLAAPILALACLSPWAAAQDENGDASASASIDSPNWVVVQPGYPGSTEEAAGFMETFSEFVGTAAELPRLRGSYYNVPKLAREAIRRGGPAFGIVSLGFYLERRRELGLTALLEAEPADRFFAVAPEGAVPKPAELAGAAVAGGPLYEPLFLERVAFAEKLPVAEWRGEPVLRTTRALRRLVRGRYRAVVLTGRELSALRGVYRGKKLENIAVSDYYPPALLVVFGTSARPPDDENARKSGLGDEPEPASGETENRAGGGNVKSGGAAASGASERSTTADPDGDGGGGTPAARSSAERLSKEETERVRAAFAGMADDPRGRELLQKMGARGFRPVRAEWLKSTERTFDAYEKKK